MEYLDQDSKKKLSHYINEVAQTHFYFRIELEKTLKSTQINPVLKTNFYDCETYYDYWIKTSGDNFFDIGTFLRLGLAVELCLKQYYMMKMNYQTISELKKDPNYKDNLFQRIKPTSHNSCIETFKKVLDIDLNKIPKFQCLQEIIIHRHLYAHNSGLVDDNYIKDLETININLRDDLILKAKNYPLNDVYWFEPLKRIDQYIECVRDFIDQLPK